MSEFTGIKIDTSGLHTFGSVEAVDELNKLVADIYRPTSIPFTFGNIKIPSDVVTKVPKTYVFLDLETTGLHVGQHGICQIGAWATGENEDHFKGYFLEDCDPNFPAYDFASGKYTERKVKYDDGAFKVNGFTRGRIEKAEAIWSVIGRFNDFLKKYEQTELIFVCQNTPFDIGFMKEAYRAGGFTDKVFRRNLDTISFGYMAYGEVLSLAKLSDKLGIKNGDAHDALADAYTTSKVFHRLHKLVGK